MKKCLQAGSVGVREKPELEDRPVVVGSDPKGRAGRGVASTCSYEARKYGIHSAMPISQSYKLCPDAAFLPVNMKLYAGVSANVMEILKGFAEISSRLVWMKLTLCQDLI
jgi:DNA polymerase IV (DinB-like DNA polymerase)